MRYKFLFSLFVVLFVTGCVSQSMKPMSREAWKTETSRIYENISSEQVLTAAEKLFELWDGEDFTFSHSNNEIHATRNFFIFAVLSYVDGTDYWRVTAQDLDGNRSEVTVTMSTSMSQSSMVVGGAAPFMGPAMGNGRVVDTPYIYRLFWSRMDFLLGKSDVWYSCDDWKGEKQIDGGALGTACNFLAEDLYPPGYQNQPSAE